MSPFPPECVVYLVEHIYKVPLCTEAVQIWFCVRPHSDHIQKWSE